MVLQISFPTNSNNQTKTAAVPRVEEECVSEEIATKVNKNLSSQHPTIHTTHTKECVLHGHRIWYWRQVQL